jgi:hypothetical protein
MSIDIPLLLNPRCRECMWKIMNNAHQKQVNELTDVLKKNPDDLCKYIAELLIRSKLHYIVEDKSSAP